MTLPGCLLSALAITAICAGVQSSADHHEEAKARATKLQSLVTDDHLSAENIARNAWRQTARKTLSLDSAERGLLDYAIRDHKSRKNKTLF